MAFKNATGGGDYIKREEWLAMANAKGGTLVMFRILNHLAPESLSDRIKAQAEPVRADVWIATGPRAGEVHMSEKIVGKGFTDMLRREPEGEHVAARLVPQKNGATDYAAANPCSDAEVDVLSKMYDAAGEDPWAFYNAEAAESAAADDGAPF